MDWRVSVSFFFNAVAQRWVEPRTPSSYCRHLEDYFFCDSFLRLNCKSTCPSARTPRPCREKTPTTTKTNQIGQCLCNILLGFGVKLLCVEAFGPVEDLVKRGAKFVEIDEARNRSSLVCASDSPAALPCRSLPPTFCPSVAVFLPHTQRYMPCRNLSCRK